MFLQNYPKPALIWQDQEISYAALLEKAHAYAALFSAEDCKKVAIYSENRPEWAYAFYAAWKNHCIAVPVDFMATNEEVAYILEDCQPEVIFCSRERFTSVQETLSALSYQITAFVFEDLAQEGEAQTDQISPPFPEQQREDTAVIIYTSGTTGSPKGVMLSFDNLLINIESVTTDVPIITAEQRLLVLLPFHHVFPLLGTLVMPMYIGATCVFTPSMASEDILKTLQTHKVTIILGVPRFFNLLRKGIKDKIEGNMVVRWLFNLAQQIDNPAFSKTIFHSVHHKFGGHIRFLICGGAALDNEVALDFKTLGFDLLIGYGMTEAAPMISFTHPGTLKLGASGQILPKNEVRIVDGEITAKGRNVMQGYYQRPEETAEVLKDGWLYTGDLGYVDDQSFLFVTGRKKEIIVLPNGKNINPEEIEGKILKKYDVVGDIGVFMHEDMLQAIIYPNFKVLKEKGIHHIEQFMRWDVIDPYNHATSPAKKITKVTVVKDELPKTRLGKLKRFELPALTAKERQDKPQAVEPDFEEYQILKAFLHEQTGHEIYADDHIELDLGLDSLDKVSLQTFLQTTFGVELKDEEMMHHLTVKNLAQFVNERKVKMEVGGAEWHHVLHEDVDADLPSGSASHVLLNAVGGFVLSRYFTLKASGVEHLSQRPCIVVPNHQSYIDGLVVSRFFDKSMVKQTYFYAEERHFRQWWQQLFAEKHNIIIMDINRELKLSLQKMAMALRSGKNIVIFPEGARTRDGNLAEFKKTFAILSCELGIPVVPVAIQGAYDAMPKGRTIPRFRQEIHVDFLPPIFPENLSYDALTDTVYHRIKAHLGELL